ncbi:MAG: pyridoxal-phosphate dependent enzyme [Gemmatimonadales bacterium]|nr:MAG: pyridoxal-phosphate dependent enzyme [Gemmatimonadales bacterium]
MIEPQTPPAALVGDDLRRAARRIAPWVRETPLLPSPVLSEALHRPVWLKFEHLQRTGSFKLRGATNLLLELHEKGSIPDGGVVACSSGNHGRAVAWIAGQLDIPATLCVPDWVDPVKRLAMEKAGAAVHLSGPTYEDAEAEALRRTREEELPFISPFDDPSIIAGQGTVALEIFEQLARSVDGEPSRLAETDLLVPLSGGGLAAGCLVAARERAVRTVAVGARRAPAMLRSLEAGRALIDVAEEETLASALSGGIGEPNRWSFPVLHEGIRSGDLVTIEVDEDRIHQAVRFAFLELRTTLEGGGAVGLAALLAARESFALEGEGTWTGPLVGRSGPVVIVLSGGNLVLESLSTVVR